MNPMSLSFFAFFCGDFDCRIQVDLLFETLEVPVDLAAAHVFTGNITTDPIRLPPINNQRSTQDQLALVLGETPY